jgi:hypothetical protein
MKGRWRHLGALILQTRPGPLQDEEPSAEDRQEDCSQTLIFDSFVDARDPKDDVRAHACMMQKMMCSPDPAKLDGFTR